MTDIRHYRWRNELGISYNESERRVSEAVRVLYSMGAMSALASVMKRSDLHEVFQKKRSGKQRIPTGFDEPDYLCYLGYITYTITEVYSRYPDVTQVNFVVSEKQNITKKLKAFYSALKDHFTQSESKLGSLLGDLTPGSMETCVPLQAADLLCWHLQRYYAKSFDRVEESRIWLLTKPRDGYTHEWERSELEELARGVGLG
jgi:hypothetical protein